MIFEWYSGSDTTLEVPKRIDECARKSDELSYDQRLTMLMALLQRERDRNWLGAIHYSIGDLHFMEDKAELALQEFTLAETDFDPFAANFADVGEHYCRTLLQLMKHKYFEEGSAPTIVDYGTRILQCLRDSWITEYERFGLYRLLAGAFTDLGHRHELSWCYQLALDYNYAAHHLDPNDPSVLESIAYAHFNLGDLQECKKMYEVFLKVADDYEFKGRVDEFMISRVRRPSN
jgi:tetratricopeptide (TPR) repeat protein